MSQICSPYRTNSRASNNHIDQVKKEAHEKKRNILHLIQRYLKDHNLNLTAETLQHEAEVGIQHQVCDNVDLEIILQEYQSYYYMKFRRQPKILKKVDQNEETITVKKEKKSSARSKLTKLQNADLSPKDDSFPFEIISLTKDQDSNDIKKPLCDFENYSSEWREMADQIVKQMVPKTLGITWQDCIGLNKPVELLKEAITYPISYSELFKNVGTWKGILLYGPPGTGKTLLAKALACESPGTFINVTSSVFTSKWRGDSEKMIKVLFDIAKFYSPTTVFIDEVDAVASTSKDANHEASRRFRSELLTQIDGIVKSEVFILATTNTPWDIDPALLRRFEKRIFVPLPDRTARNSIFRYYLNNHKFTNEEIENFTDLTEHFCGSDINVVCKEANMTLIREKIAELKSNHQLGKQTRKLNRQDVVAAIKKVKPCTETKHYKRYFDWCDKYGSM